MGGFFAKALNKITSKKKINLIMVGLDAAGKTTILYKLKLGQMNNVYPYPFYLGGVETVEYKNITFNTWDLGGQEKIRPLWRHYYTHCNGIIFVVDCNDQERLSDYIFFNNDKINLLTFGYIRECFTKLNISNIMPLPLYSIIFEYGRYISPYGYNDDFDYTAQKELERLLSEDELQGVPLLIFANKQDLPNALSINEVTDRLQLNKILQQDRKWHIESSCATTGDGLYQGLEWLSNTIKEKK